MSSRPWVFPLLRLFTSMVQPRYFEWVVRRLELKNTCIWIWISWKSISVPEMAMGSWIRILLFLIEKCNYLVEDHLQYRSCLRSTNLVTETTRKVLLELRFRKCSQYKINDSKLNLCSNAARIVSDWSSNKTISVAHECVIIHASKFFQANDKLNSSIRTSLSSSTIMVRFSFSLSLSLMCFFSKMLFVYLLKGLVVTCTSRPIFSFGRTISFGKW